jgi:hypothetical protein
VTEPDRLAAMREAAADADAGLAALDALIRSLRANDPARAAVIDPDRSWARIAAFLDAEDDADGDGRV